MSITFYAGFEASPKRWNYIADVESVNVSSSNGRDLIAALGFQEEDGCLDPVSIDTFMDRCSIALCVAEVEDEGRAPSDSFGERGARFIDCGQAPGYIGSRMIQLRAMARAGKAKGATHIYAA